MAVGGPRRRWRARPAAVGEYAYARPGAGASYLLGAIEHDEAWHGYTVLRG